MGQRSQQYIILPNIGKAWAKRIKLNSPEHKDWADKLPEFIAASERYERWKNLFGEKDTITVGFHHQWLYNRSHAFIASRLLFAAKVFKDKKNHNPFSFENWEDDNYIDGFDSNNPFSVIEWLKNFMCNAFFDDSKLGDYTRHGIERFSLMNENDVENNYTNTGEDFTIGDNNDGVLIVDFLKIGYCFVNIHGDSTVEKLPYLIPVDVKSYVRAYSPENISMMGEDDIDYEIKNNGKTLADIEKHCKQNLKINKLFFNKFKKEYKLLTTEDLIESFPALEDELIKAENTSIISEQNKEVLHVIS